MNLKKTALGFVALAILSIAFSLWCSQRSTAIQGPSALAVAPGQSVWLSVDFALWQLTPQGQLLSSTDTVALGIPGRVGNIASHPDGHLVLGVRDVDTLYFFDPVQRRVDKQLTPRWPPELAQHASRAVSYAFAPDGKFAISTGGGHAVALFDADGQFLRRTPEGLYRFTNGLWWEGNTLWTTNTNAFELIALSPQTMTPTNTLKLLGDGYGRYLGMAISSKGQPRAKTPLGKRSQRPLATVVRFQNDMLFGRVVDVFPDGLEREFQTTDWEQPRDIVWSGSELLVVDGWSYSILRFNDQGQALPNFGDESVTRTLQRFSSERNRLRSWQHTFLYVSVSLLLVGLFFAGRASKKSQTLARPGAVDLVMLGLPQPGQRDRLKRWTWHLLIVAVVLFWFWTLLWPWFWPGAVVRLVSAWGRWTTWAVPAAGGLVLLGYLRGSRVWAGQRQDWESVHNARALRELSRPELAETLAEGEVVRETLSFTGLPSAWLVMTNQRVLVFTSNRWDRKFRQQLSNTDIALARLLPWRHMRWRDRLAALLLGMSAKLEIETLSGEKLRGYLDAVSTAKRVVSVLALYAGKRSKYIPSTPTLGSTREYGRWPWQIAASAAVPGLGQWMQRRRRTALWFFLFFAFYSVAVTVPLLWSLYGPRTEVAPSAVYGPMRTHFLIAAVTAWDCWAFRRRS